MMTGSLETSNDSRFFIQALSFHFRELMSATIEAVPGLSSIWFPKGSAL